MNTESKDFIERVAEGDHKAFAELVGRYKKKIYAIAFRMLGNHLDADEVTQETFVRLYARRADLKSVKYLSSFILRIAANYSIDLIRRRQKKFVSVDELAFLPDAQAQLSEKIASPDLSLENEEIMAILREAIQMLPPRQKLALVLHDIEGHSKLEIADSLGCPQATVRSNLHIARSKLKKWLAKKLK
jgi:RNA polymerase sigma-70 factor (ECF subfamily)